MGDSTKTAVKADCHLNVKSQGEGVFYQMKELDQLHPDEPASKKKVKILSYFFLWFSLSVGYNIFNKKAVKVVELPWVIATVQMFAGIPLFLIMWITGIRKIPIISFNDALRLFPVAIFVAGAHMCAVMAMYAGSVSFAQIIKSGEPLLTAMMSIVLLREMLSWKVYITLIPVVAGVSLASISEPEFSWLAFVTAMAANLFSSLKGVYSKMMMNGSIGKNVDARNLYGVLTLMSFSILFPIALIMEGYKMGEVWDVAAKTADTNGFTLHLVLSGMCYYAYNEVAFSTLELVSPVTHAVGSTFKRVFIIVSSIIIFKNYPDCLGYIGMIVAIVGVGVYSLAKTMYKPLAIQELPTIQK